MILLPFLLLTLSIVSVWVRRDSKIWGGLLGLSLFSGLMLGMLSWIGLFLLIGMALLWSIYDKRPGILLLIVLTLLTTSFKLKLFPGFYPLLITSKFHIGLEMAVIGLLPLALLVPLSQTGREWKEAIKGLGLGCAGIGLLAILATVTGTTHWEWKLPSFMALRTWSNLILTSIPEEGFYRGFLQRELGRYFNHSRSGNLVALLLTSVVFTVAHAYWSPHAAILGFVFLASLLYGGVYLLSGRIESAILSHFLLNLIHMIFFEYHAT